MSGETSELPSSSTSPEAVGEDSQPIQKRSLLCRLTKVVKSMLGPTIDQIKTGEVQRLSPFSRPLPTEEPSPKVEEPSKP